MNTLEEKKRRPETTIKDYSCPLNVSLKEEESFKMKERE